MTLETEFERAPRTAREEQAVVTFLERVLSFLGVMGGEDPDAGGSMSTGEFHVSVTVEAVGPSDAFQRGAELIQRAVGEAGVPMKEEDWQRERFVVEPEETTEPIALMVP